MPRLLTAMLDWSDGTWLEQRAAVAALCEPALVRDEAAAAGVLRVLDRITASMASARDRDDDLRVLRQTLGYGWSVAIVGAPEVGTQLFGRWMASEDRDVRWMVRENLKKARLDKIYRAQSGET